MAGLATAALGTGGLVAAVLAYGVAGLTMALLAFAIGLLVGTAHDGLVAGIRRRTARIKQAAGYALIAVAAWFALSAAFADRFARVVAG